MHTELNVDAIFSDYDGTLSPFDVNRDNALIPLPLYETLRRISKIIPLGIISTKTINYLEQKIEFAKVISGMGGLEYKIDDEIHTRRVPAYKIQLLETILSHALSLTKNMPNIILEEKRTAINELFGFTVDWRMSKDWSSYKNIMRPLIQKSMKEGLDVITYRDHPFFDVYAAKPDKGKALQKLKRDLKIKGQILYLGDSENDNTAFEESEISIGVTRRQVNPVLKCEYLIRYEKLNLFLKKLIQNKLRFDPELLQLNKNPLYKLK